MIATEFVQPPWKEEPVDTDPTQVPFSDNDGDDALCLCNLSSYCDAVDHSFADSDASTSLSLSSSDQDDFSDLVNWGLQSLLQPLVQRLLPRLLWEAHPSPRIASKSSSPYHFGEQEIAIPDRLRKKRKRRKKENIKKIIKNIEESLKKCLH